MKLKPQEVDRIVGRLLSRWKSESLVTLKCAEADVRARLNEVFLAELKVEDDLNKEVEQILSKFDDEFAKGDLDRQKMFLKVKAQLVRDRGIIL